MKQIFFFFIVIQLFIGCSSSNKASLNDESTSEYSKAKEYNFSVENMPTPVGTITAIQNKVVNPEIVKKNNIDVMVYVNAYINESGSVDFVEIRKGINPECDKEAMRVVKESRFNPGFDNGIAVKTLIIVPIVFR
jgi:protein TonB